MADILTRMLREGVAGDDDGAFTLLVHDTVETGGAAGLLLYLVNIRFLAMEAGRPNGKRLVVVAIDQSPEDYAGLVSAISVKKIDASGVSKKTTSAASRAFSSSSSTSSPLLRVVDCFTDPLGWLGRSVPFSGSRNAKRVSVIKVSDWRRGNVVEEYGDADVEEPDQHPSPCLSVTRARLDDLHSLAMAIFECGGVNREQENVQGKEKDSKISSSFFPSSSSSSSAAAAAATTALLAPHQRDAVVKADREPRLAIFIDSLSVLLRKHPIDEVIKFVNTLRRHVSASSLVMAVHSDLHERRTLAALEYVSSAMAAVLPPLRVPCGDGAGVPSSSSSPDPGVDGFLHIKQKRRAGKVRQELFSFSAVHQSSDRDGEREGGDDGGGAMLGPYGSLQLDFTPLDLGKSGKWILQQLSPAMASGSGGYGGVRRNGAGGGGGGPPLPVGSTHPPPPVYKNSASSLLPQVSFSLGLSESERIARSQVVLPYEHQGVGREVKIYDGRPPTSHVAGGRTVSTATFAKGGFGMNPPAADFARKGKPEDGRRVAAGSRLHISGDDDGTREGFGGNLWREDEHPAAAEQAGEPAGAGEPARILYVRDSDDEVPDSDEDPDDDLDI